VRTSSLSVINPIHAIATPGRKLYKDIQFGLDKEDIYMNNHISGITLHPEKYPCNRHYPFSLPIFNNVGQLTFETPVTFFVGENGTGKSTLLEAIALACHIHIWKKSQDARVEYNPYEKQLFKTIDVKWVNGKVPGSYFGSEIFNDFREIVDDWAASDPQQLKHFGGKSLVTQSHGQSMMSYFKSRYKIKGLYFLDEPETALSPKSQLEFLNMIEKNTRRGHAQFIIATHSPLLLAHANATIFSFDNDLIRLIEYKETDHYRIYKRFLSER
jgi:predicted ATPase